MRPPDRWAAGGLRITIAILARASYSGGGTDLCNPRTPWTRVKGGPSSSILFGVTPQAHDLRLSAKANIIQEQRATPMAEQPR
jgi:hypothetical protein